MNIKLIGYIILIVAFMILGGIALHNYCVRLDYEAQLEEHRKNEEDYYD